ncbi:MAG: ABC transporter permease [Pseudomarimonas sp.]
MVIRHALRSLKRAPIFTIAVILTLAVGVASVASMFAIVYGVLLAPLPYGEPERLLSVRLQDRDAGWIGQPPALYVTYSQHAKTLDGVGFYRTGSSNLWTEGDDDVADSVVATWITASMVPMLQIPPLLGRSFNPHEELRGGPNAVMLSEAEWRSRFNAAPDVIGKILMVNSVAREIIGVMPARFSFPTPATRVWLPAKRVDNATVGEFLYAGVARLAPGATAEQVQSELVALLPRMAELFPQVERARSDQVAGRVSESVTATWLADVGPTPIVKPLREEVTGDIASTLWMLAAASGLVLLVAWANVTNLLLIRADGRQPELAVRAALGAARFRTATHFLGEALVLGATAGVLALLLTYGAVQTLVAFGPADVPRLAEVEVGLPTIAFIILITILGVIVSAVVPAGRFWRTNLPRNLREAGRGASTGKSRLRVRHAITTLQIAVALVVTIGSALLLRTAFGLYQVHPGFEPAHVTTLRTQLPSANYDGASTVVFYARLAAAVRQLPLVESAGLTVKLPLAGGATLEQTFRTDTQGKTRSLPVTIIDDGYFAAMSIPLLAGQGFRSLDQERGTDIIISRQAAATLFGDRMGTASVGKKLFLDVSGLVYTVIGVVGDVRDQDLATAPTAMIYRPLALPVDPTVEPAPRGNMALVVRSSGPPGALVSAIRQSLRQLDPTVAIYNVETMDNVVRASTARLSLVLTLMTASAAITLVLGMIGLYGVMAYMVALRTREFGVRVAMGADPKRITRLVASRGFTLTASGVAVGFVLYALAAPFLRAFLYGVTVADPATLLGATLVLMGTAALASWFPARRAARVDPAQALRTE